MILKIWFCGLLQEWNLLFNFFDMILDGMEFILSLGIIYFKLMEMYFLQRRMLWNYLFVFVINFFAFFVIELNGKDWLDKKSCNSKGFLVIRKVSIKLFKNIVGRSIVKQKFKNIGNVGMSIGSDV